MIKNNDQLSLSYRDDGNVFFKQKMYKEAIELYNKGILKVKDKKELSLLYSNRSICYYNLEMTIFSLNDAYRSFELDPHNIKAILRLAKCAIECDNYKLETFCYEVLTKMTKEEKYMKMYVEAKERYEKYKENPDSRLKVNTKNNHGKEVSAVFSPFKFKSIMYENTKVSDDPEFFRNLTSNNPLIEIADLEGYGRGVLAKKNIKKDSVIIYEEAAIIATLRSDVCGICLKKPTKPIYSEFKEECYCSKECQTKAWETYFKYLNGKKFDKFKEMLHDSQTDSNKMYVYVVKLFAMIQVKEEGSNNINHISFLKHLCTPYNPEDYIMGRLWECFLEIKYALNFNDTEAFDFQYAFQVYLKMVANVCGIDSFEFRDHLRNASGIFPTYTYINHSCSPNAVWKTGLENLGNIIEVKATRDIKKGEQVFISYVNDGIDKERKAARLSQYGIKCNCDKCV